MIKKSVYPKTIKIDSIKNTYTITEKLDGSNLYFTIGSGFYERN
jgi:hypothetical protein